MKKIIEGIKDFIYDSVDYFIIISVVLAVGVILGWRLPQLFTPDMDKQSVALATNSSIETDDKSTNVTKDNDSDINNEDDDLSITIEDTVSEIVNEDTSKKDEESEDNNVSEEVYITVEIPSGSLSTDIAKLLLQKGLIDDTKSFLTKAKELKLDTKLQSGTFKLKTGSSLKHIIEVVSRQK